MSSHVIGSLTLIWIWLLNCLLVALPLLIHLFNDSTLHAYWILISMSNQQRIVLGRITNFVMEFYDRRYLSLLIYQSRNQCWCENVLSKFWLTLIILYNLAECPYVNSSLIRCFNEFVHHHFITCLSGLLVKSNCTCKFKKKSGLV